MKKASMCSVGLYGLVTEIKTEREFSIKTQNVMILVAARIRPDISHIPRQYKLFLVNYLSINTDFYHRQTFL